MFSQRSKTVIVIVLIVSLIAVLAFFHLAVLIGVGFAGVTFYILDRTIGVIIHNNRLPSDAPREDKGLWVYERPMWTRTQFVFWVFVIWFGIGVFSGKLGLGNILEVPAQAIAFLVGMLLGPLGYSVWERRREIAAKADKLEQGLKAGTIDPMTVARDAAVRVSGVAADVVSELSKLGGSSAPTPSPTTPIEVNSQPPAPSVESKQDQLAEAQDRLRRFNAGEENIGEGKKH